LTVIFSADGRALIGEKGLTVSRRRREGQRKGDVCNGSKKSPKFLTLKIVRCRKETRRPESDLEVFAGAQMCSAPPLRGAERRLQRSKGIVQGRVEGILHGRGLRVVRPGRRGRTRGIPRGGCSGSGAAPRRPGVLQLRLLQGFNIFEKPFLPGPASLCW